MCTKVDVYLNGVNASDSLLFRRSVEHTLVVGHDEPYIRASSPLAERESIEKCRGGLLAQVERHESKPGETGDEPGSSESRRGMIHSVLAQILGNHTQESVAGSGGNVAAQNAMLLKVILLPPRIEHQARIAWFDGSGVVANQKLRTLDPGCCLETMGIAPDGGGKEFAGGAGRRKKHPFGQ
jgi:hypothetical protein